MSACTSSIVVALAAWLMPLASSRGEQVSLAAETIRASASAMRDEFSLRDHEVLLGRKRSVDWALLPALVMSDIARGAPPIRWGSQLDDGYGCALPIPDCGVPTPPSVEAWCRAIADEGAVRIVYRSELARGTLSEYPVLISWSGDIGRTAGALATDWFEPALGLRGIDFPLLPDRVGVRWNDELVHVGVLGSSMALDAPWPEDPPSFTHLANDYDIAAGLRAWYWATRGIEAWRKPGPSASGRRTARSIGWRLVGPQQWELEITLRESTTPRSAGFALATSDGRVAEPIETGVRTVPPNSRLVLTFLVCDDGAPRGRQLDAQCGLSRLEWWVGHERIAWAEFDAIRRTHFDAALDGVDRAASTIWTDAMTRVRAAQSTPSDTAPIPNDVVTMVADDAAIRSILCANAWVHAAHGDLAGLHEALVRFEATRRVRGCSHHDLAALTIFAESIAHARFPEESVDLVVTRIGTLATQWGDEDLWEACDLATGCGRFWAGCEIAAAALARARTPPWRAAWLHALGVLSRYRDDPDAGLAFECDAQVREFGLRRAARPLNTVAPYSRDSLRCPEGGIAGTAAPMPLAKFRAIDRP